MPTRRHDRAAVARRLAAPAVEAGLILLAAGVPLAIGGVHRPTILTASLIVCLLVSVLWWHRRPTHRGLRVPWFGGLLLLAFAWTLLQMVPLPLGLLRGLAPATVEVLEISLGGAGGSLPAWHPISLDASATLWEALKIGTCALAFLVAHNHFYRRHRRDRLLLGLVMAGVLATLTGFIGAVAAPGKPLMLYEPAARRAGGLIATSFVNPNHGSAFLNLCAALAVGLAVAARDLQQRVLLGLGGVLLGAGVFLSLSRGGILALGLAFAALAVLLAVRRSEGRRGRAAALVPAALALVLLLAGWLAFEAIVDEFRQTIPELNNNLGKVGLWAPGLAMARENAVVGVGRGAFLTSFPRYLSGDMSRAATYSHLENQYLHLPAEWGFPVALLVVLGSAVALLGWLRRSRPEPQVAAMAAGLLALAGHALFDFNLEVLGVALPAAVLCGALSASRTRRLEGGELGDTDDSQEEADARSGQPPAGLSAARSGGGRRHRPGRGLVMTGTVLAASGALLLASAWAALRPLPLAEEDLARLSGLVLARAPLAEVEAAVREVARRHPADPMPHLLAGRRALDEKSPAALAWLNRATFLFPGSPDIHLETARALRAFGRRRQSLLEYRLAIENGASAPDILRRALPLARNLDELDAGVPARAEVQAQAVRTLIAGRRMELAAALVARSRGRWPRDFEVAAVEIELELALGKPERALELARRLARATPQPRAYHLWARAASATLDRRAPLKVLEEARRLFPGEISFTVALAEANLRARQLQSALKLAEQLLSEAVTPAAVAQAHDLLARIHLADGRPHRARYEAEQARKIRAGR